MVAGVESIESTQCWLARREVRVAAELDRRIRTESTRRRMRPARAGDCSLLVRRGFEDSTPATRAIERFAKLRGAPRRLVRPAIHDAPRFPHASSEREFQAGGDSVIERAGVAIDAKCVFRLRRGQRGLLDLSGRQCDAFQPQHLVTGLQHKP